MGTVKPCWFGASLTPLPGGYAGETFSTEVAGERVVVRIYRREPKRAPIDASLLRLLRGIIPVPEVLEVSPATPSQPAILVTDYLRGVPLDQLLRNDPDALDWETLGYNLGWVLGSLSGIPFLRSGSFVDSDLSLSRQPMPADLAEWAQRFRGLGGLLAAWQEKDWKDLLTLVDDAEDCLSDGQNAHRVVLAHSDFNPKNILVDPRDCGIVGVVDWEFAHAGSMHTDFGNFTRFERDSRLEEPMIEGFVDWAPGHIRDPFTHGRAIDLWALIELAGRSAPNPVCELANTLLLAQARERDLSAWPWPVRRVDPPWTDAVP